MVNAAIHGDGLTSLQYRKSKDAENLENVSPDSLPAVDGSDNPKQVTTSGVGASYLHGISPDNQIVIFTGNRNGKYDIFAADVNTMEETQLTDTPDLDDGSEYSPDGKYIYFNSNRTGTMQIWRMNADGSNQTQLTFDENFNEWFPHISPDGKKMGYMSYGTDVESADHPFYKNVTLRMMPLEDGEPEVIVYLYGGQGTINVPSWSPDSKKWHLLAIREGTISVLSMIKWRCLQIRDFTV
jgi:Tol biopolymer transport system component